MTRLNGVDGAIRTRKRMATNPVPVPTDITSSVLPAGASTEATQVSVLADLAVLIAGLLLAQGSLNSASVSGPLLQAVVGDAQSYTPGYVQPASLTPDGRLRVSVDAVADRIWQHTFDSPWPSDSPWGEHVSYE